MVSQSLFATLVLPVLVVARPVVVRDLADRDMPCGKLVTVQAGDSCQSIASQNGLEYETMLGLNPKLECSSLEAGNTQVCVRGVPIGAPTSGGVHLDPCRLGSSSCEVSSSSGGKYIDPDQPMPQANLPPAVAPTSGGVYLPPSRLGNDPPINPVGSPTSGGVYIDPSRLGGEI